MAELFVTNFNRNYTGVSATAANVIRQQSDRYDLRLVGVELPGCPAPMPLRLAKATSARAPKGRPFAIWHVRRNTEMRAAIWARDVLRLPIRIVFTSAAQRRHSAFPRWLISRMDAVIATTDRAADFVPHVRAVVPHGVDCDRFFPAQDKAEAWAAQNAGGAYSIATIGRIRPEKGTDLFVDTMLRALPHLPGAMALVLGRAGKAHQNFLNDLRSKIESAGLSDRFLFPGEAPARKLPEILRSVSLVVQMPRYEGYGMVPLEAMASAVPFVATDAGYYRSFSANGTTGQIVGLEDCASAAEAIVNLLQNPAQLQAMSLAARATAKEQFGAAREADGIGAVYEALWSEQSN